MSTVVVRPPNPTSIKVQQGSRNTASIRVKQGGITITSLNQLSDVDTTGASDGEVLVYNGTTGLWNAQLIDATSIQLTDIDGGRY